MRRPARLSCPPVRSGGAVAARERGCAVGAGERGGALAAGERGGRTGLRPGLRRPLRTGGPAAMVQHRALARRPGRPASGRAEPIGEDLASGRRRHLGGISPGAAGSTGHIGYSQGVSRVGLPDEYFTDGPLGPRQGPATAMPAPMGLAATFDPALAYAHGSVVGRESRDKGNDAVFGPTVNIMRTPLGGRTFEAYGEDPFLDARLAVGWIKGAQSQGVMATVKHFVANNQEGQDPTGQAGQPGAPVGVGVNGTRYAVDEHIDDRTLHEIYMPHFEAAVRQAHAALVMCSYNQVNRHFRLREPAPAHRHPAPGLGLPRRGGGRLRRRPSERHRRQPKRRPRLRSLATLVLPAARVEAALATGLVSAATLDVRVRDILRTLFAFGFFDRPGYRNDDGQINQSADAGVAQRVEESAITLLRNTGVLPLRAASGALHRGDRQGRHHVRHRRRLRRRHAVLLYADPLDAIRARAGRRVTVSYNDGSDAASAVAAARKAAWRRVRQRLRELRARTSSA